MIRYFLLLLVLGFLLNTPLFAQDVWLQNHFSPNSGCQLSAASTVNVLINNNSSTVMPANTINVNYSVDGGTPVVQLLNSNLIPGASWNFSFNTGADVSGCGQHEVKVWVSRPGDMNPGNDTIIWIVRNDCNVIPGTINGAATVCESGNSGTLSLTGWMYGTIMDWEYSVNGGVSWQGTGQTGTSYSYAGLNTQTRYRVRIDGGYCADAVSGSAVISMEPLAIGGNISGAGAFCTGSATGLLQLNATPDPVIRWEYSQNAGANWNSIANSTSSQHFTNLSATTWYRAYVEGGACPDTYSPNAIITVQPFATGGTITGESYHCANNANDTLQVNGNSGPVNAWQSSIDNGVNWTTIPSSAVAVWNYSGLFTTTWYRALIEGGTCPDVYTDTAVVVVQPVPPQPILTGATSLCGNNVNGNLTLTGPFGTVLNWESSTDNGSTWNQIANTSTVQSYTGQNVTTVYRVLVEGNLCPDVYSNNAVVQVDPVVNPGLMLGSDTLCINNASGALHLLGSLGTIAYWQRSTDNGVSWNVITNTTDEQVYNNLTQTTWYRAFLEGGNCPDQFSDTGFVYIDTLLIAGHVAGGDSICESIQFGSLALVGANGNVSHWEMSTDFGDSWDIVTNTTNQLNYFAVNLTTWYRVYSKKGACLGGYSDTAVIYVDEPTTPGFVDGSEIICPNDTAILALHGFVANHFTWQFSHDLLQWDVIPGAVSPQITVPGVAEPGYYRVEARNGMCAQELTLPFLVDLYALPSVDAGADVSLQLYDSTLLSGTGEGVGVWSPSEGLETPQNPVTLASPTETTMYFYTVTDSLGCRASDSVLVEITIPDNVQVMNMVTTNGDGHNDTWVIAGIQYFPETSVAVYNMYGKEVFASTDYKNDWNGTQNDKLLPDGTYYYVVIPGGTGKKIQGTLVLIGRDPQ